MKRTAAASHQPDPAFSWSTVLKVEVGGRGVVAHAGVVLPRLLADRIGLTGGLRQLDALNCDRLGPDLTPLVQTSGHLDDGTGLDCAWGITARSSPAGTSYSHGGNVPGWSARTVRRPSTRTAVALLTLSNNVQVVSQAAVDLHEPLPVP